MKRETKRKISKTVKNAMEERGYEAPDFSNLVPGVSGYRMRFLKALTYAGALLDYKDLKKEVVEYAKSIGADIKAVKAVHEQKMFIVGKYAWILNNGGRLEPRTVSKLVNKIAEFEANYYEEQPTDEKPKTQKKEVTEQQQADDYFSDLEDRIIESEQNAVAYFQNARPSTNVRKLVTMRLKEFYQELKEYSSDPQVNEAYKFLGTKKRNEVTRTVLTLLSVK